MIPYQYYYADRFSENIACVIERRYNQQDYDTIYIPYEMPGSYRYIGKTGKPISGEEFAMARRFSDGYGYVERLCDMIPTYIDKSGNLAAQPDILKVYDRCSDFVDGYATIYIMNNRDGLYGND